MGFLSWLQLGIDGSDDNDRPDSSMHTLLPLSNAKRISLLTLGKLPPMLLEPHVVTVLFDSLSPCILV